MDYLMLLITISFLWTFKNILTLAQYFWSNGKGKLPPGPLRLSIIGNFLELGNKPHHSLAKLSKTYGPIMSLKLGTRNTVVVTSPYFAQQVLQVHDRATSDRPIPDAQRALDHHKISVAFLPPNAQWKVLRKLCNRLIFSAQRLDSSQALRTKKVQELLDYVDECCNAGLEVDIGKSAFITSLNLMSSTLCSIDLAGFKSKVSQEFKDLVRGFMEESGRANLVDLIPILEKIDPQGIKRRSTIIMKRILGIFDEIVDKRIQLRAINPASSEKGCDVLDALLNLTKEDNGYEVTSKDIKHLLLDLFTIGTDTTSSTLEWAMAELLRDPAAMAKAKSELEEFPGGIDNIVHESDLSRLPYLQAVLKETLRMHPAAPLLIHKATTNIELNTFIVPKDAEVIINAWAISQDPDIWLEAASFKPERFLDGTIEFRGQHFEYLPFGAGRRMCPGMPLASRMVPLMLASLIHSFDWKLAEGTKPEDLDMNDRFGITLQKAVSLRAIPVRKTVRA